LGESQPKAKCHDNIDSVKLRLSARQSLLTEDITVDTFLASPFGTFMTALFPGTLSAPSWHSFTYLAYGWSLAWGRQTITTYLWLSGAASVKHFSRYYTLLGRPLYKARYRLWAQVIRCGASLVPPDDVITIEVDDHTAKKSGRHIEGRHRYRNGAGSARQEYRVLEGINLVLSIMRIPLKRWPEHHLSLPIGLELYLKEPVAQKLGVTYQSRSQLARRTVELAAEHLPARRIHVMADGGFATGAFLHQLPPRVEVTSRLLITAKLYEPAPNVAHKRRGAPAKKGRLIGSAKTLAQSPSGWHRHPQEAGALVQSWVGIWHSVLPGRLIRVVLVRRPHLEQAAAGKGKKPFGRHKPLEAFFSTNSSVSLDDILAYYEDRWAIEIAIRDARALYGLAQDQCRKLPHIIGANTFRLLMAAARTLWFITQSEQQGAVELRRYRPWYWQKVAPSPLDVAWACREALGEAGIFPIPRFFTDLGKKQHDPDIPLASTA
jgi:hypothetical protein